MKVFVGYKDYYKVSINGVRYKEREFLGAGVDFGGVDAYIELANMANKEKFAEFFVEEVDVFRTKEEYAKYDLLGREGTNGLYRYGKEKYALRKELEEIKEKLGETVKENYSGSLYELAFGSSDKKKGLFFDNYPLAYEIGKKQQGAEIIEVGKELKRYVIGTEEASLKNQVELAKSKTNK